MIITGDGDVLGSVLRSAVPGAKPDEGSLANASDDFSETAHLTVAVEDVELPSTPLVAPVATDDDDEVDEKPAKSDEPKTEAPKAPAKAAPAKATAPLKSALDTKG